MKSKSPIPARILSERDSLMAAGDSTEDFHDPLPSPPYRAISSSSNIVLEDLQRLQSPAYRPRVDLMDDESYDGKYDVHKTESPGDRADIYPVDVHQLPEYAPPMTDAIAPSMIGTDEEHEDEEDGEDYDWSADEDLDEQQVEFEKQMGIKRKPRGWGFRRIVTLLFSSLIGSTLIAALLVAPAILLDFFWYKKNPTEHRRFVTDNVEAWLFWAAANILISWYLAMAVDIIPVIVRFLISASWGHVSESVKNKIELYDSVKKNIKPVLYAAIAWLSWIIIFEQIFELQTSKNVTSRASYTDRARQAVEFLFFFTLVVCAQRMLSQAIAFAFHRVAFADRIESVRKTLSVIEHLRNYQPKSHSGKHHSAKSSGTRTPVFWFGGGGGGSNGTELGGRTPFSEKEHYNHLSGALKTAAARHGDTDGEDGDIEDGGNGESKKNKGKQKRRSMRPAQREDSNNTLSTLGKSPSSELLFSKPVTPSGLDPNAHHMDSPHQYPPGGSATHVGGGSWDEGNATLVSAAKVLKTAVLHDARNIKGKVASLKALVDTSHEAKRLAKSIYYRFKDHRRTYLVPSDFYPAYPTHAAAESAFRVFDKDGNDDISRTEIKFTLLKVYKERHFLARSMRDVGVALKTLDRILLFFAFAILFFISLSVFGVQVDQSLTSVYTIGIGASFIFKNAASNAFDAVMFLFVTHPFDTGDRCFIDNENFVVKKMGLFATVFTRSDGTETYYFNSLLFTKFITNVRRSGKMFENLTMQVAWRTPMEKLDALEKCVNEWLQTEENRWFEPSTSITFQTIDYQRHLVITMAFGHNGTWQDWGLRCARKTAFHTAVQYYCRELGIEAYEAPRPVEYADSDTQKYMPSSPMPESYDGPLSPGAESMQEFETSPGQDGNLTPRQSIGNVLGFKPPRDLHLSRARKSKSRKAVLRSMGAGGA